MRRSHNRLLVALTLGISFSLQSCVSLNQGTLSPDAPAGTSTISYTVQSGDSLTDIAHKLTGDAANWSAIAERNAIEDPDLLNVGDTLQIPQALLVSFNDAPKPDPESQPDEYTDSNRADEELTQHSIALATAATLPRADAAHVGSSLAMKSIADPFAGSPEDVALFPVSVNRLFTLVPLDLQTLYAHMSKQADTPVSAIRSTQDRNTPDLNTREMSEQNAPATPPEPPLAPYVRIVGTYYPKVIYAGPGYYTDLVMRVLPGTVFELDSEVNDWYKVKTDKGTGFVRNSDAVPVDDAASL